MLRISYDEASGKFSTKTPVWFDLGECNSLAYWVIFYMEISLWVHYMAFVRQQLRPTSPIFIPREKQYINLRNELGPFWETFHSKASEAQY